jgi:tRNA C32,U32 (ribose-2'-O)-methylase TrmJ
MRGGAESLNAAVAAAVMMYEIIQRVLVTAEWIPFTAALAEHGSIMLEKR